MRREQASAPTSRFWLQHHMVPLCLILVCPPSVLIIWYTHTQLGGSLTELFARFATQGFFSTVAEIWQPYVFGTKTAWTLVGIFAAVQLLLMRVLPGKDFRGPVTPTGDVPVYRANGPLAFAMTMGLFFGGAYGLGWFEASIVYHHFGGILGALNSLGLVFCLLLYVKGRVAPSSDDHGATGSIIFDYYWGTELYPRILGWDVKMFTNCRFGMMAWPIIICSFAAAQAESVGLSDSMRVAVGIQLVFIAKFFWWETGYLASLDIMHDRAGFYICWGCLVWVPGFYTASTLYLVNTPNHLGWPLAALIFSLGVTSVLINYTADAQRQRARATNGNTMVWGKKPVIIVGHYQTDTGEIKTNVLLASGWWGIARHFHYIPEILGAFFWTLPALFSRALPYAYVVFLVILLTHRAFRDDRRCAQKYGDDWKRYRARVPYMMIPGVM